MDSHFRSPINFYVAPEGDRKLNTVVVESAGPASHQWSAFISSSEMQRLIDGLKALDLHWNDFKGREAFKPGPKRADDFSSIRLSVVAKLCSSSVVLGQIMLKSFADRWNSASEDKGFNVARFS